MRKFNFKSLEDFSLDGQAPQSLDLSLDPFSSFDDFGSAAIDAVPVTDTVFGNSTDFGVYAPGPAGSLQGLANFLKTGYWSTVESRPGRYYNIDDNGSGANFGILYYNVSGFGTTLSTLYGSESADTNGLTTARQTMAREAFDLFEEVLGINFIETTSTSSAVDFFFSDNKGGAYAASQMVSGNGGPIDYTVINVSSSWSGGSSNIGGTNGYTFQTFVHEIGHALGLGHQGQYNGGANYNNADFANDSWQQSIMSYFDQTENTSISASYAQLVTPMAVDWLALDQLYSGQDYTGNNFGVSNAFSGNTVYGVGTNISSGLQAYYGLAGFADTNAFNIIDGGGVDTIDFSNYSANQLINLAVASSGSTVGSVSNVGGLTGNMTLGVGTVIENARSGSGNDIIYGNSSSNDIYGGDGSDNMYGYGGNDDFYYENGLDADSDGIYGGAGTDRIILDGPGTYNFRDTNVTSIEEIEFAAGAAEDKWVYLSNKELDQTTEFATNLLIDGNSNTDANDYIYVYLDYVNDLDISGWTFQDWNTISGTLDYIYIVADNTADINNVVGTSQADQVYLYGGNDTVDAGAGDDLIYGGDGVDVLNGGDGNDTISAGSGVSDVVNGGAGDDLFIYLSATGYDEFNGGAGIDTADFSAHGSNMTFNLVSDMYYSTPSLQFDLLSVENVIGGAGDDLFIAANSSLDESLDGGDGIDTLDTRSFNGTYVVNLALGTTNYAYESFVNFENVITGDGNDTVIGSMDDNIITTNAGDDVIDGGDGDDTIYGGDGDDIIDGGNGVDAMYGGAGNDSISINYGASGHIAHGGAGFDTIDFSYSSSDWTINLVTGDTLIGTSNYTTMISIENVVGSSGDDLIIGTLGNNDLSGGLGDDDIRGGAGNDVLTGNEGLDRIFGQDGADTIDGGAGDDTLFGGNGNDYMIGGDGADLMYGQADQDTLVGEAGIDTLIGGAGEDFLYGGLDDDFLSGQIGDDTLFGGSGNDALNGQGGNDLLIGETGDDVLNAGGGDDELYGGADNDTLNGATGADLLYGGLGSDLLNGGGQNDILYGGDGGDTLNGSAGNDTVYGDTGNDVVNGQAGADILYGGNGDDELFGGSGSDDLYGGAGNDVLSGGGGIGNDELWGDIGSDIFAMDQGFRTDRIKDFENGSDLIDFSANALANDFADVQAAASQVGSTVRIELNANNTVIIENFMLSDLDAADFIF